MTGIPAEMGATLLRTSSLGVSRGRVAVLHDVTVDLQAGEIVAVLGPNGAGKSTLLEALSGQLAATAGAVERIGRIATAMQSPDLARRSVRANVELALAWWGVARPERPSRAAEALTAMGVMDLAERRASSLSGGERRRVHLARALALRPDVLLLDEPFAGLDPQSRGALLDTTRSALRVCAQAVVVVVHDRAEAWALADRVIVMLGGRVVADGAPRDVLERPPSQEVARFLGFTGELREGDEVVLTRPAQVHVGPEGDLAATVKTIVPLEDGARAELVTSRGSLWAVVPYPGPAIGDHVKVRVTGGVRFPCHDPAVDSSAK